MNSTLPNGTFGRRDIKFGAIEDVTTVGWVMTRLDNAFDNPVKFDAFGNPVKVDGWLEDANTKVELGLEERFELGTDEFCVGTIQFIKSFTCKILPI